jgi:hypothetical protein
MSSSLIKTTLFSNVTSEHFITINDKKGTQPTVLTTNGS